MEVTFVTSNPSKVVEARGSLEPFGIRVRWARRKLPELQADTLEEVVRGKLESVRGIRGRLLVEDSGIFLEGLKGFPGVYSHYALGTIGLDGILALLRGRGRRARFRTVMGLRDGRSIHLTIGESRGSIAPRCRGTNGFGYDPLFIPNGDHRTFAEMTLPEKNAVSHRGRAMRAMAAYLRR